MPRRLGKRPRRKSAPSPVYAVPHPPFLIDEFREGPPAVREGLRLTRIHQRYILFRRAQGDSVAALALVLECEKSAIEYHLRRAYADPELFRTLDIVMPWNPPNRLSPVYFCRYCAWTEPNRVAIWLRVSSADQDVENQRLALERYCEQNGFRALKEFVADGFSAWKRDHLDRLKEALYAARRGKFDCLMCWSIDRLTRQGAEEALRIVREFNEAGVRVLSVQEPWLSGDADQREMMLAMSGVTARIESARRSERNRAASLRMIASNIWWQGRPPLGYRRGEDGRLQVVEEESETVRLIYDTYDQ